MNADDDPTDFIRASREICRKATPGPWMVNGVGAEVAYTGSDDDGIGWTVNVPPTSDATASVANNSQPDATFIAHARTALPRALDMLEAQQREAEKWRDARDELARARRWDVDKLERQMDVVAEQLVVALRDGDALRKQLAEQQAEIERVAALALACADWRHCDCFTEYDVTVICERCKMCAEIKGEDR